MTSTSFTKPLCVLFLGVLPAVAGAGRPLLVDDAATNAAGHGHIESWYDTQERTFNIAPAFAPIEDLELGAAYAKSNASGKTSYSIQAKKLFTSPKDNGCNTGATLGRTSVQNDNAYTVYGWGILSCHSPQWGSVHLNVGWTKERSLSSKQLTGVAFEYPLENFTPHAEWTRLEGEKGVRAVGARTELLKDVQLDGSYRVQDKKNYWTLGVKWQF